MKKLFLFLSIFISLSSSLIAQCQADFSSTVNGLTVNFQDSSYYSPNVFSPMQDWTFGDGNIGFGTNPSHTYTTAGTYTACLTIYDSLFTCFDTICYSVSVIPIMAQCQADFTHNISGLSVQFFDSSVVSNSTNYTWSFGDGSTSFLQNPSHTYNQSGNFIVNLSIFDSLTICSSNKLDTVVIFNPPGCAADYSFTTNQDSLFIQNLSPNYHSIVYDFDDGNFSTQPNPTHIYLNSGQYVVCQTIIDTLFNCSDTKCDTVNITIPPPCKARFSSNVNGFVIDIVNQATSSTNVYYDFGDGTGSAVKNPTHTYNSNGTYVVCQSVSNPGTGCTDQFCDTVVINVAPPCQAGFSYQSNYTNISFTNQAQNFDSISYDFGDGSTSGLTNPAHTYLIGGNYIVCQTVTNGSNCTSIFCDTIQVQSAPPCNADFSFTTVNDTSYFTGLASNYSRLVYHFGDGDSSIIENPIHNYTASGSYNVKLIVYNDSTNCVDSISKTITVNISSSCVANFQLAIDTNQRDILFLINTSSSDNTHQYLWDFGDGSTSSIRLPNHQYAQNRAYNICLTVFDTVQNCTSTYCDSVGLDSNGQILKSAGFLLKVLNGTFIGIDETDFENSISVYPNPFTNFVKVVIDNQSNPEYAIYDLQGKLLAEGKMNRGENRINTEHLEKGIYFLRLQNKGKAIVKQIIKM